jgi:FlaG/FlaF family flagellin (archaellin)
MKNVRKITKIRRSIKAISPVISVLLMIAIAVVASLVVYAWVMGYIGGTTSKVGNAITVPSFATDQTSGNLIIYVQNVGQGSVQLDPAGAVYVNDALVTISTVNGNPASGLITIPEGQTVALVVNSPYNGGQVAIKVVTTGGTSMQTSGTGGSGGGSATLISTTLSCTLSSNSITLGQSVTASGSLMAGSTGVSGKIVTITYSLAGQADVVDTKATDSSGAYSDSYTPNVAGSWSVTASFAGDSTYALSSSAAQSLAVNVGTVAITITSSQTGSGFVTVDGNSIATPQIFNWVPGASHTIAALSPVSGPTGTQYVYTSWSDSGAQSHTYTVPSSAATVTANYKTQYQVTFDASANVKGDSSATIVTAAGNAKTGAQLPYTAWYDSGSSLAYSFASPIASSGSPSTTRYLWSSTSGLSQTLQTNTFTVGGTGTITATYTTQTFGVDSSGKNSANSANTLTVGSLNCAPNDVVIVLASSNGGNSISSVTGGGLTWTLRGSVSQSGHDRIWEYYAVTTSTLTSVTVNFGSSDMIQVIVFGISGANTASTFDGSARTNYASTTSNPSVTGVSTSNANDMIIGLVGTRSTTDATAGLIAGTAGTLIQAQHASTGGSNPTISGTAAEYRVVISTLSSQSVAFGTVSTNDWAMITDAVQRAW